MRHSFIALVFLAALISVAPRQAAAREICFPNQPGVVACLTEPFADYWESNGGLPVFGYPLGPAQSRRQGDADLLTQWTERARLEFHPDNPSPYTLLMGRLGA